MTACGGLPAWRNEKSGGRNEKSGGRVVTSVNERSVVDVEVRVAAKPETIFPFLSDATKVPQWFGSSAEVDPRPGGVYRVVINNSAVARGEVVEIKTNERIVFTFGWEGQDTHGVPPGSSRVEITLRPDGDGTIVRLHHTGLPAEAANDHRGGWELYAGRLKEVVEGRDPGRDPNAQG
jgi:uncharacterized protein YndB with AHSA1/START domain